jgi:hypothetical protein
MIPFLVIAVSAFLTAGLTLYSGFGLGTLLMPVFALFFPVEAAVAATAVVHGANNAFKIAMVGKHADRTLVLHFGIPAILAAFVGAAALGYVSHFGTLATYEVGPRTATVTPVKLVMALLMFAFALFELLPRFRELRFDRKYLPLGGVLSGFFGGFSGHQGALRSAFLVKTGTDTKSFVGTSAVIGFLVDLARIATYALAYFFVGGTTFIGTEQWPLVIIGVLAAFAGVLVGQKYLHKVTMSVVQNLTGALLLGISLALGAGII